MAGKHRRGCLSLHDFPPGSEKGACPAGIFGVVMMTLAAMWRHRAEMRQMWHDTAGH